MRVFASLVGLLVLQVVGAAVASGQAAGEAGGGGQVLYLRTEFQPYEDSIADHSILKFRLCREVARQALLVAAREHLHLPTRDESLGQRPPEGAEVVELVLFERSRTDTGRCTMRLCKVGPDHDLSKAEEVWSKEYKLTFGNARLHVEFVHDIRSNIATDMVEALKLAGLKPGKAPAGPPEQVPDVVENLLAEPTFMAQYEAIRLAHEAMARGGASPEWYAVLARGYAHLGLLSKHHWSSEVDVFLARSWTYAEQYVMLVDDPAKRETLRAYAYGIGGHLGRAGSLLKRLEPKEGEPAAEVPEWAIPLRPYVDCDRTKLYELAMADENYSPWAHFLWFEQTASYRDPQWSHHAAMEVLEKNPLALGIFAHLAISDYQLGTTRFGGYQAPRVFGGRGPLRVGEMASLPKPLAEQLSREALIQGARQNAFNDPNPNDPILAIPTFVARELRTLADAEPEHPFAWDILATFFEEEQFVEIANFLKVSQNATESSDEEFVDGVLPLIEGHRYAPYIESYRHNLRADLRPAAPLVAKLKVVDPKQEMRAMWLRLGAVPMPDGKTFRDHSGANSHRQFTFHDMLEYFHSYQFEPDRLWAEFSGQFTAVAPKSELATRFAIRSNVATPERLAKWEASLREDARSYALLGDRYLNNNQVDEAMRCYQASTAASPTIEAAYGLSSCYYRLGDLEGWEEALLAYLETESLGLEHARIHNTLAWGLVNRGQWGRAEEHAIEAAGTYSAWGLMTGSRVLEGLSKWDESEQMARACSESYPTTSGDQWYYWCQRNGRGDLEEARELASRWASQPHSTWQGLTGVAVFYQLEGDPERAAEYYKKAAQQRPTYAALLSLALLASQEGDREAMESYLSKKEALVKEADPEVKDPVNSAGLALIDLMRTEEFDREQFDQLERLLHDFPSDDRGVISLILYFMGEYAAAHDETDLAITCWRRSLGISNFDPDFATLSGFALAQRLGTSREEDDIYDVEDVWPSLEIIREATMKAMRVKEAAATPAP